MRTMLGYSSRSALKWASELGIDTAWNMLTGLPGEVQGWYSEMAKWLPSIFHLQPPSGVYADSDIGFLRRRFTSFTHSEISQFVWSYPASRLVSSHARRLHALLSTLIS